MKIILLALLIVASCSFKKTPLENQTLKGHQELYSEPNAPKDLAPASQEKRIVIASTNDVHGNYRSELIAFKDDHQNELQNIRIGGVDVINNYFKILRDQYKNVVLVDSGDILAEASSYKSVNDFYTFLNYDAMTVGLRDFNLKVPESTGSTAQLFKNFAKSGKIPLLVSNLYELKTARVVEWEGTKPYIIKEVNGIKVGILGLIPDDIVAQTPVNNRIGLFVENMLQSTLRHARLLRSLGAEVIVVLTHQGIDCSSELAQKSKLPLMKVNFEPERKDVCNLQSILGQYLERLPPHLVDVVIGGRNHMKMANFVNGTLVMGGFPDGRSFNYAEFVIDSKTKKVVPEKTVVHQPVIFCHEFFKETKDCFSEDPSVDHKLRIPATFLGSPIERDLTLEKKFPGLKEDKVVHFQHSKDIEKSLAEFKADISLVPASSGETQLFVLPIQGKYLAKILEEDFNQNNKGDWKPSPFKVLKNELVLKIAGEGFDPEKTYRILTDLESIQKHSMLNKSISSAEAQALPNHSWISIDQDSVSSSLAAQAR